MALCVLGTPYAYVSVSATQSARPQLKQPLGELP
jgi:hypothetical protein